MRAMRWKRCRERTISRLRNGLVTVLDAARRRVSRSTSSRRLNIPLGKLEHRLGEVPTDRTRGELSLIAAVPIAFFRGGRSATRAATLSVDWRMVIRNGEAAGLPIEAAA